MKVYLTEREGQFDFFEKWLPLVDKELKLDDILFHNTDGVIRGNLLEFKLGIENLNATLFQAIKYLSTMRVRGRDIPRWILLIDLNAAIVYVYDSSLYLKEIETIYFGSASKSNQNLMGGKPTKIIRFNESETNKAILIEQLRNTQLTKINIDENCIVGYAERYYRENKGATKASFIGDDQGEIKIIGEIRRPSHYANVINPYTKKTNKSMAYVMDRINDTYGKKALGAFYTPDEYAIKSHELIFDAIRRHQDSGNTDYIIIDASAGTGNLQMALNDNVPEDILDKDILKHCILSTYEYYEWKVLLERIGDKVRHIIPPVESPDTFMQGFVRGSDALSKEFIHNDYIKQFIDDPKCTIIVFENPPYRDDSSGMTGIKSTGNKEQSYVVEQMKSEGLGSKTNEIANRFIWRAFKYYIRKPEDSYIVYAPIKYWKYDQLISNQFKKGFVFNRKHFHASPSAITCIWWTGVKEELPTNEIELEVWDINEGELQHTSDLLIPKSFNTITNLFDKEIDEDYISTNWFSKGNGTFRNSGQGISYYSEEILGYMVARGFGISNPNLNFNLTRLTFYDKHGFYITKKNFMEKLPILSIKRYLMHLRPWYEIELVGCSADKGNLYTKDKGFLKACFIFANLDYYNKTLSLKTDTDQIIKNNLCFDEGAYSRNILETLTLNNDEKLLLKLYDEVLSLAKLTDEYNKVYTYSVYQINLELNAEVVIDKRTKLKQYKYPELNTAIVLLREETNKYFDNYIKEKLIKYELIK